MVTFATPPREPNRWFVAPTTPMIAVASARPRRRLAIPVGVALLLVTAFGVVAQLPRAGAAPPDEFARNRNVPEAARLLRDRLGPAPRLQAVRATMAAAHVYCRDAEGHAADSLLVCLGAAVRFNEAYTRMAFRVVSHGDSVRQVVVCPALVSTHPTAAPADVRRRARPTLQDATCWRDPHNPAHADWTYVALPGAGRFTTVPEPDAPRMRAESMPTPDTVHVIW